MNDYKRINKGSHRIIQKLSYIILTYFKLKKKDVKYLH